MNKRKAKSGWRVLWIAALIVYIGVLVFYIAPSIDRANGPSPLSLSPWEVERVSDIRERLTGLGRFALVETVRFLPLGLLLVLALPEQERRFGRFGLVFVPGVAMAVLLSALIVGFELGFPGVRDLVLPAAGCFLGGWLGMSARRGLASLVLFFPKLALGGALVAALAFGFAYLATESQPLDLPRPQPTSEHKRELVRLLRRANPSRLDAGETHQLALTSEDLDALLGWGFSAVGVTPRTRLETGSEKALVRASIRLPVLDRYLNVSMGVAGRVRDGALDLGLDHLSAGPLRVPSPLLAPLSALCETAVRHDRVLRPVWAGIDELRFDETGLSVSYGPMDLDGDAYETLLGRLGPDESTLEAARAQLANLAAAAPELTLQEDRFAATLKAAFTLARERSSVDERDPVVENRGAILALSMVLGHPRLRVFAGLDAERDTILDARRGIREVTLRDRADWTQHFFVSAGLTQLSSSTLSDAAGVLKEELDADTARGGSGFSFADLLADRAGTLFARTSTLDPSRAIAMQERIVTGFRTDDFFPSAEGLAEGIADAELRSRFGGVGGAEYRRVVGTIEERLSRCAAYR